MNRAQDSNIRFSVYAGLIIIDIFQNYCVNVLDKPGTQFFFFINEIFKQFNAFFMVYCLKMLFKGFVSYS